MKTINLAFKQTTIALAGNPFGKNIFKEQVLPQFSKEDDSYSIVFPDQISFITSSFVQGFFDYWLRTMSSDEIKRKVEIKTRDERVKEYIWANLE